MGKLVVRLCTLTLGLLALAACGGGSGGGGSAAPMEPPGPVNLGMQSSPPAAQAPPDLPPPSALPLQTEQDTDRMRTFLLGGTLHIGGEIDASNFNAGSLEAINGVTRSFLADVSTGESPDTLAAYLHEDSLEASRRYTIDYHETVPVVLRNGDGLFSPGEMDLVTQALQIINEALPADFQLRYERDLPAGRTPISVFFAPREEWQNLFGEPLDPAYISDTTLGQTRRFTWRGNVLRALVQIDLERSGENRLHVLVHELMHALGRHHVPQSFNTIMISTLSPSNPGHLIYPLDTDALQAVYDDRVLLYGWRYMDADAILRDLGDWTQATDQFLGRVFPVGGGMAEFGAQLRNGHVRAFARGPEPQTDFVNNPAANLGATWRGALSGFTYTGRPLQGTTRLDVDADLQGGNAVGGLLFRRLESFDPGGLVGTPTPYAGGSLDYRIEVRGNTFRETSRPPGTEDRVDGAFFTREHRAMGGVLQRSDARAGFGGERQ